MTGVQETQMMPIPTDLVRHWESQAKAMGLSVVAYLRFITRVQERGHDAEFVDAGKFAFSKYPGTLRKLAQ